MIPFVDLQTQQTRIKPQLDVAIARVLAHGKYIMGPEVKQLEELLAAHVGSKHCIAVSNGTDALSAALMAFEVGPGDAVITTSFTFFATIETIMLRGATPIFADIDPRTYNICPHSIRAAIKRVHDETDLNLKGIVPVDLYGLAADYDAIHAIANEHDLFVLQDAAQAFGAVYDDQLAPTHGHIGTASFFPAKPLGCYGDGGAVFTDDDARARIVDSIRIHGKGMDKYDNVRVGLNARLDTIQAAVLIEKLKIYPDEFERRQTVAQTYTTLIGELNSRLDEDQQIKLQHVPDGSRSAWAQFVIQTPIRNEISAGLMEADIPSVVYYRTPAYMLKACHGLPAAAELPISELVSQEILALPFHPYLETATIEHIVGQIEKCVLTAKVS